MRFISIPVSPLPVVHSMRSGSVVLGVVDYFGQPRMIVQEGTGPDIITKTFEPVQDGVETEGRYVASYVTGGTLFHLIETSS